MDRVITHHNQPALRLLIPLIAGIIIQDTFPGYISFIFTLATLFILFIHFIPQPITRRFAQRNLPGICIILLMLCSGGLRLRQQEVIPEQVYSKGICSSVLQIKEIKAYNDYYTIYSRIECFEDSAGLHKTKIRCVSYLKKDSSLFQPQSNCLVIAKGYISPIKDKGNPDSFDFSSFLKDKGYFHTLSIKNIQKLDIKEYPLSLFEKSSERISSIINGFNIDLQNRSLVKALILGIKSDLKNETKEEFADAGVAHILALSGLHTGIIYLLLSVILFPLKLLRLNRLFYSLIILCLWGYAAITGFSPSVSRAVIMLTVFLTGKILMRNGNNINTLSCAALIILIISPRSLFDVGFQLSFSSVASIIIFYPYLKQYMKSRHKVLNYILQLMGVSISAQILVLPISIYYFQTLPVWFVPANLLIIPILTPFIICTVAALALYMCGIEWDLLYLMIDKAGKYILGVPELLNRTLPQFESLHIIYIDKMETVMCIILILGASLCIKRCKARYLIFLLTSTALVTVYEEIRYFTKEDAIVIFNERSDNGIHYYGKDASLIFTNDKDTAALSNAALTFQRFNRYHKHRIIQMENKISHYGEGVSGGNGYIHINGSDFLLITDSILNYKEFRQSIKIRYLVLGKMFRGDIPDNINCDSIILMSSLPYHIRERLKQKHSNTFDISQQGAFIIKYQKSILRRTFN